MAGPTLPAAISRSATTVGLSFSQGTLGSTPRASCRERLVATSTSWNRLSTLPRQSSTVTRAIRELRQKGFQQQGLIVYRRGQVKGTPRTYARRESTVTLRLRRSA